MSDKEMKKGGRGTYDSKVKDDVQITKWMDSKAVYVASSQAGILPLTNSSRYDKHRKERIEVPTPRVVQLYNANMGGVDLHDMLVEINRVPTRSKRWYLPIIGYLVDLALVNSYLLYKRQAECLGPARIKESEQVVLKNSKEFRLSVSKALRGANKTPSKLTCSRSKKTAIIQEPRGYRPDAGVRYDELNHFASFEDARKRCKFCSTGITVVMCMKCNVHLCLGKHKNCFYKFHSASQ